MRDEQEVTPVWKELLQTLAIAIALCLALVISIVWGAGGIQPVDEPAMPGFKTP